MKSEVIWILAVFIVIQSWIGFSMVRYAWRCWHGLADYLRFLNFPHYRFMRRLIGEDQYRDRIAYLKQSPTRSRFSMINFVAGLSLLLLSVFYLGVIVYDLLILDN